MKVSMKWLMLPLAMVSFNAIAAPKLVQLPFTNEPIFTLRHTGLFFNYDLNSKPTRSVVCKLSNVYKGWLVFKDHGAIKESGVYGDSQTIILTNKGPVGRIDDATDSFHVDAVGSVTIKDIHYDNNINASASCYYMMEGNR